MPFDRISRWEWRRWVRNPLFVVGLAAIYAILLAACDLLNALLGQLILNMSSLGETASWHLGVFHFIASRSLLTPLPWFAAFATCVAIQRNNRTGRMRDLRLSPLRSSELFLIKIPPIALAISLVIFLGTVPQLWLDAARHISFVSQIPDTPNMPRPITDPTVITGLTIGAGALRTLVFTAAAVCLMCAWRILLPRRASAWSCAVIATLSASLLMVFSFRLGFVLCYHTRIRWDFPVHGLPFWPMINVWESIVALPLMFIIALWLIPRFGRVYEGE